MTMATMLGAATMCALASATVDDVAVFRDRTGTMTAEQVASLPVSAFTPDPWTNFGWTTDAVWVRFSVTNTDDTARPLVIDVCREWVNDVRLYAIAGSTVTPLGVSGSRVRLAERPLAIESIAFPFTAEAGRHPLLLRLEGHGSIAFHREVYPRAVFEQRQAVAQLLSGGYYGLLLALSVWSLLLFVVLRDRLQLLTGVALSSWGIGEAASHGHLSRLLPFWPGELEIRGAALAFAVFIIAYVQMSVVGVRLNEAVPRQAAAVRTIGWVLGAAAASASLVPALHRLVFSSFVIFVGVVVWVGMGALRRHERVARAYGLAFSVQGAPGSVALASMFGFIPYYPVSDLAAHVGSSLMGCVLALVVARQLEGERQQVAALAEELRYQVNSRSRELIELLANQHAPVSAMSLVEGDVVGHRYRVIKPLGSGGWGAVYEVERSNDAARFALKRLSRALSGLEAARLAREAEVGARLRHPNLVSIVDVGVDARGAPYAVMDLIRGGSLEDLRGRFGTLPDARSLLLDTAQGLAALHRERIAHRDIKPANVLLHLESGRRVAKVSDFGIARPADVGAQIDVPAANLAGDLDTHRPSPPSPQVRMLTARGALIGTPLYMAPEGANGAEHLGPHSDVFSFGVMAYEVLSGRGPYAVVPVAEHLAGRQLGEPPSLDRERCPEAVAECLRRCVAEAVASRPTMAEIVAVLSA